MLLLSIKKQSTCLLLHLEMHDDYGANQKYLASNYRENGKFELLLIILIMKL